MKPKTRSNILASILQNPTLLEEAYEQSKNSQGVGQRELDVYLDSIEAKLTILKNSLSELAFNTIDSEGFKVLLDIINQLISAVGTLTKTFGGLNVILGTISGFMLQKNGLGMLPTEKGVGWLTLMQNMRTKNAVAGTNNMDTLKQFMPSWFSNFNLDESITRQLSTKGVTNPIVEMRASPVFGPMIQDMKDYEINAITAGQAQEILANRIEETSQSAKKFSSFLPSLRGIASALLTTAAITVALKGVSMLVEAFYKLLTARKDAIKAGKEAIKDMEETGESYKDATASVKTFNEENAKRYFELKNKNDKQQLSTDEYEEFTQISKEMADLFPSLVTGFDDQGNAMVNLGNDAGEAKDKLAELLQQEKEIADFKIAENLQKAVKGIVYENEDLQDDVDKQDKLIKTLTGTKDLLNDGKSFSDFESDFITFSRNGGKIVTQTIQGVSTEAEIALANAYISAFDKAATSEGYRHGIESFEENGVNLTTIDLGELDESQAKSFLDAFKAMATEAGIDIEEQLTNAMMIKSQDEQEIKANWNSIVPGLISSMNLYDTFADLDEHGSLGETLKQMVIDDITGIGGEIQDWEDEDVDKLVKQTRSFVRQKYWDPIRKAIYDTEGNYQEDNAKILDQMLSLEDTDGISVKKYQGQIKNLVDQLFEGFDNAEELREELLVALDIKYVTEDGKSEFTSDKQLLEVAKAAGLMNDGQDEATIERVLGHKLDESQLSFVSKELEKGLFTFNNENGEKTIDDFVEYVTKKMEEAKKASKIEPQDTLMDIFNDETYKTNAEEYEKKLTSLTGALKTIREEGTLTAEAMRDLQEEFPDLTDFSMQGIEEKATGELKKWIEELRKGYDDLNEEGKAQIDTYTENLERSYGNLHVTEEQAMKAAKQSVVGSNGVDRLGVYNKTMDELIERIKKRYGDVNWQLILELALEDNLSGNIDDIYDKYNHKVVTWELELKSNEIQNEIDNLTSERDVNSARQSLNAANGYSMTAEDYDKDNTISEGLIAAYKEQRQIAIDKVRKLYTERGLQIPKEVQDQLKKDIANYDKSILDEQTKQVENTNAKEKLPLTQLQNQAELIGLDQDSTKDAISRAEKRGKEITKAQYEAAIEAEKANKDNLRRQHRELIETQQELIASGDNTADNELWRVNQKAIQENEKAYEDAKDAIDDYSKSIDNIPLSHLQISLKDIDRELELTQREIDSQKEYAGQDDYLRAMEKNAEKEVNLRLQIAEKMAQKDDSWDKNSEKYQTWQSELQELEDQLYNTTTAQNEFIQSLANVPVDNLTRAIEKYKNELSTLQAQQGYREAKGEYLTAEDYQSNIDLDRQMATKSKALDNVYAGMAMFAGLTGNQQWVDQINANRAQNQQEYYDFLSDILNNQKLQRELPIAEVTRELEKSKLEATGLQEKLDEIARSGRDMTKADYTDLDRNAQDQIGFYEKIRDLNQGLADDEKIGAADRAQYASAAVEASSAIASLKQQQYEWNEAVKQLPMNNLINSVGGYKDLQREAAEVEKELNEADQKHQKTSGKLYDDLIKNGKQQIDNLKKQRDKWRELQNEVRKGSQKWQEYQDEIDNVNNSIDEMEQNQRGWIETMSSLISTNAAELSSVLATAFSEINSETGLTIETMNELERQFSDLEGHDVSKIFYQSADGMKFNVDAAEELVDAEYELQTNNLESAIAKQEEVVRKLGDSESETAQRAVRAANDRISSYNRELAMLQALYDQQKQQFSNYAQWQTAQQTENAGAHYEDLQGYLKTQNEAYNKGLTGTDEFRAYTEYFDQWGMDTVASWERNKEKVKRYLTEDSSGLTNFMNDLVGKGLATKDADGMFTLNLKDQQAAADTMGMSKEWFNDMVSRSEDYGFINTWVDSELDGRLQLQEQTEKLVEEQLKLNQAMRDGASQEVIDNQQAYIDEIKETIRGITEATNIVKEADSKITSTQIQDSISNINAMRDLITPDMSKEQVDLINNAITEYAASHHIILEPDVELNSFKINEDAMQKAFPEYDINLKPNWDALEEAINGKPKTIEELTDGILNPVQLQSAMEQQTDTLLSSAAEKVKAGWDENDEALQGYLQTLQGVDREVLNNIKISNKGYDVEEKYHGVEDALQGIADMFGITQEEGTKLVEILELIGAFKPEQTYDAPKLINEDGSINLVAGAQKVGDKVTGLFKTAGDEIKHQMEQAQYEKESEPVTTAIADQTTTVTGFLGDIVGGIGDVVSVLQTGNTTKEQPVVGNTQTNTNSPTKPNDNKPQNAYTDTGTGDRDNVMSILAQRELENAQKQQYEDQSQPVVNALSDLSQQVSSGDSDIVNAVNSLPEAIVAATNKPTVENPVTVNPVQPGDKSEQTQPQQATTTETKPLSSVTSYYGTDTGTVVKTVEYKPETGEIEQTEKEIQNKPIQQEVDLKVESSAPQSGQTITNTVTADTSSAEKSIDRLAHMEKMSQQIDITAADKTDEGVDSANNSVETKIKDKTINLGANDNITSTANQAQGSINSLTGKTVSVDVDINGLTDLNKAKREIQEMKDKRIEVTTVMRKETKVLGTATVSHASGTAYGMWESYRHSIGAYANGSSEDWELKQNEQALVNEFAPNHPESIVRDGKWMIIPGGPHVEQLKKGDIIFNAQQTDDLIRTGRTAHAGKIAYSTGTAYNMINAHATRTTTAGGTRGSIGGNSANTHQKTGGLSNNNNALKANTDQLKKNKNQSGKDTKKVTTAIDKFKKYFENLKDWIEVRLQRRDEAIELNLTKNENETKHQKKNSFVTNAEEQNKLKTNTAKKAIKEYEDQAKKVKKIALKTGLIPNTKKGKKRADDLYNKVMNGDLSIEEMKGLIDNNTGKAISSKKKKDAYTSKELTYVEALTEWIDKMYQAQQTLEECKQKAKELAQTRLDNITEQFETLAGYAESVISVSDSMMALTTARGRTAVNDEAFKKEYRTQMTQQNYTTGYLRAELKAYDKEMEHALEVFGRDSNEYHQALTKQNEIQQAINESEQKYYDMRKQAAELEFTYISQIIDRIKAVQQTINGRISLAQARNNKYAQNGGESENTSFYEKLYGNLAATNNGLITEWKAQYDKAVKYIGEHQLTDENAEEYQDYYNRAIQAEQEIYSILQDQENIKKNLRDLRWKSFNDLQKTIQETISDLDALRDTMRDAEFFDSEYGIDITDKGYANLQLLGQSIQQAKQQIKDYRVALEKLDKEYKNGNITVDEYNNLSREYTEQIQDSAKAVAQSEDSIVNMYTTMIQNENQLLQDNINKRKEALQTKKQYYDWDKQIKDKNKDIVQLQAQLNALQGVFICPYLSNCWKTLKVNKPQHKDETCLNVMV